MAIPDDAYENEPRPMTLAEARSTWTPEQNAAFDAQTAVQQELIKKYRAGQS